MNFRSWCITIVLISTFLFTGIISAKEDAKTIVQQSGVQGGLIVHLGCTTGKFTADLKINKRYTVQGLGKNIATAKEYIHNKNLTGDVSVMKYDGLKLPYANNLVNLLVITNPEKISRKEMLRVIAPLGTIMIKQDNTWQKIKKAWPKKMSEWTHYLNTPQNNAVADDNAIGQPRSLRWVGGIRWARTHEEMASISALVSAHGRIFYIVDEAPLLSLRFPAQWKLVAEDGFNGKRLWEIPISQWCDPLRHFRSGPVHLPRRLVAVGEQVFVTLGLAAPISMVDAGSGKIIKTFAGTEHCEEIVCDNGIIYALIGSSEEKKFGDGLSEFGEPKTTKYRYLKAIDIATGKILWKKNAHGKDYIIPLSVTVQKNKLFLQDINGIKCLDTKTGKQIWYTPRKTVSTRYGWSTSTLVVTDNIVLCTDRMPSEKNHTKAATGNIQWGIHGWTIKGIARRESNTLIAYSAKDGHILWKGYGGQGTYNSPVDLFVIKDKVWIGPKFTKVYDLQTGKTVKTLKERRARVGMVHNRCYRSKATTKYILTGKDGIEFIDINKGWIGNNSWIRGTCQYGILPTNGLLIAPPDACACHPKVKLQGFNAVSKEILKTANGKLVSEKGRLEKGELYNSFKTKKDSPTSWLQYRNDTMRSGTVKYAITKNLQKTWTTHIGGKLTQAVSAYGKLFLASIDQHTIYALDANTGKKIWHFVADGRIDSTPTIDHGMVAFGSVDGYVYCLSADTGKLIWRFKAAPMEHLIMIHGQLESSWPVHGSVLVHNNKFIITAGRSSYLDGGIYFYALEPRTGKMLATSIYSSIDPKTGKQTAKEKRGTFDSEGTLSDLMTSDGTNIYLKHLCFNEKGKLQKTSKPHLFTPTGFFGEEWFIRTYWLFGTDVGAGYFKWSSMQSNKSHRVPAGRIICFNNNTVYGYGRIVHSGSATGHRGNASHLFSSTKIYKPIVTKTKPSKKGTKKRRKKRINYNKIKKYNWSIPSKQIVRAMLLSTNHLYIAGVPDLFKKNPKFMFYDNPQESLDILHGKLGSYLWVLDPKTGKELNKIKLDAVPTFDGISATPNKLFISFKNGNVSCYNGNN